MNVLIARGKEECAVWSETAVVIDVLRGATTACALLDRGKKDVLLFKTAQQADAFLAHHADFEVFSDEPLSSAHADNSPFLASKSSARQPALLLASSACKAAWALRRSSTVLLGGFCNFYALTEALVRLGKDVLLVPAALFSSGEEEDILCAGALKDYIQGVGTPQQAIGEFGNTMRMKEFHQNGPKTAEKDSRLAFKINGFNIVPQLTFAEDGTFAVCHPSGSEARWLNVPAVAAPDEAEEPVQASEPAAKSPSQTDVPPSAEPAVQTEPTQKETGGAKTSSLKSLFGNLAQSVKEEAQNLKEKASAAAADPKAEEAKSKIKNFFSEIVRSVKEEKKELQESLFKESPSSARERTYTLSSDDPFDALMKQSEPEGTHAPQPAENKASPTVQSSDVQAAPALQQENSAEQKPEPERSVPPVTQPQDSAVQKAEQENSVPPATQPQDSAEQTPTFSPAQDIPLAGEVTFSGKNSGFDGSEKKKKAIVLFSGGLDSTTCLYWAIEHGYECEALTVSYGQRHDREVLAAQMIARNLGIKHHLITLNLPWLVSSALVDKNQQLPDVDLKDIPKEGIPSTYVPGRNLMFLSIAGSLLDAIGADAIIAGPNAVDFSGYPDCTPAFFKSAADALNRGTKMGVTEGIEVLAPLMRLSKTQIVQLAAKLKVPFELTWSCYAGGKKPCGHCDSCKLRAKGFAEAGVRDTSLD